MRFTQTVFALAALTSTVFATDPTANFDAISNPSAKDQQVATGSSFDITWSPSTYNSDSDTVSIVLLAGNDPSTLVPGATIASSVKNKDGKFTWTVPSSTAATYGFRIQLDADNSVFQYSFPFHITGGSASSSSASASGSSSATSGSASATSTSGTAKSTTATSATANSTDVKAATSTNSSTTPASTVVPPAVTAGSNLSTTLQTTTAAAATKTSVVGAGSSASTSASSTGQPASVSSSSATSNMAQGGLALIGGAVLAFML